MFLQLKFIDIVEYWSSVQHLFFSGYRRNTC